MFYLKEAAEKAVELESTLRLKPAYTFASLVT